MSRLGARLDLRWHDRLRQYLPPMTEDQPRMKPDSPNWVVMGDPATPEEAAALDAFRELLHDDGITRAWVNLTFIDLNGRAGEIDVLLLTRRGFFVVELKGWHGRIAGDQQHWHQHLPGGQVRTFKNPLIATDNKAKRLGSLLKDVSPHPQQIPFLGALVVMHGRDSKIELDALGRTNVLKLDGFNVSGPGDKVRYFLTHLPEHPGNIVDAPRAAAVRGACQRAGFTATPRQRRIGQYVLDDGDPVAAGRDWQDFVVSHPVMSYKRRLRLFDLPPQASAEDRSRAEEAARREMRLTESLLHEGVDRPLDILATDAGPALLFEYDDAAQPLDQFLAAHDADLDFDTRIALIRQIGEVLRYAHNRHLAHRALAPQRVWVTPEEGRAPRVRIRDWYTGQREASSRTQVTALSAGLTDVRGAVDQDDWVYLAREALHGSEDLPSVPLDVYGVGALAYLVLTGEPHAATLAELQDRFSKADALDPLSVTADIPDDYAEVVRLATAFVEPERMASIEEFLDHLDIASAAVRPADREPEPVADPLDAQVGAVLTDRFIVEGRRGEGSTGTALVVVDADSDDDRPVILKVARNDAAEGRLAIEAEVLAALDHPRLVRLLEGPIDVDGRSALLLSDAGRETLATRIATEGRATIEQLERYGRDLLEAVAHLDERGVFHRDIKPANLAIAPDPGTRKPRLTLFDLSLAREPLDNIRSGTPGYLDPYLGQGGRHQYDRAAELWSVAVTLFELATGNQPWWPEGVNGPATADEAPVVMSTSFEDAIAAPLTDFFRVAMSPRASERFAGVAELASAWAVIFADLDESDADARGDDSAAEAATLTTPLSNAGLSARALSAVQRLDAVTVGDLLGVPPVEVNRIRGLGERYRKEIQQRVREWRSRLRDTATGVEVVPGRGVEGLVRAALTLPSSATADEPVLRALLGLRDGDATAMAWPTAADVARTMGASVDTTQTAINRAVKRWQKLDVLSQVRADIVAILAGEGRVMTLAELAQAVAGRLGSQLEGAAREHHAIALIRTAVEVEEREDEPRLSVRRRATAPDDPILALTERVNVAGEDLVHLSADVLADIAETLGERADKLVVSGVVPAGQARSALRGLVPTGGDVVVEVSDERLVRLAGATSQTAAVSGFGELYSRDLPIADAIDHALRGRPGRVITEMWVRRRVSARFPDLRGVVPSHPTLDPLVTNALPGMEWDGKQYVVRDSTTGSHSVTSHVTSVGGITGADVDRSLRTSLRQHAPLTLAVAPHRYQAAVAKLASRYQVGIVDVASLVIQATREMAAEQEVPWEVVLDADAAERGSFDWEQLTGLVREALAPRWQVALEAARPLLVVNAGPLVRYGMSTHLSELLDLGTPRPAARWLLVARSSSSAVPLLEGRPVPLGPSGALDLPSPLDLLDVSNPQEAPL